MEQYDDYEESDGVTSEGESTRLDLAYNIYSIYDVLFLMFVAHLTLETLKIP